MKVLLTALAALFCCSLHSGHLLDPTGKNVCHDTRDPSHLVCCSGWQQEEKECSIPVCEGDHACLKDEMCLSPGVCRCPAGYFGAQCKSRCPSEFWAPDCRQMCPCYPHGRCHPSTGECTCFPNRWGPICQHTCKCTRHGRCHAVHGNCTCDEGWWLSTCAKPCQCFSEGSTGSGCDQLTGRCQCQLSHWGQKCAFTCNCNQSPCHQRSGVCECVPGWWGSSCEQKCKCDLTHSSCDPTTGKCLCHPGYQDVLCDQPCEAGKYGRGCLMSCGYCRDDQPCSVTDGLCSTCEPGWNGTRCDVPCSSGFFGDGCKETCPRCRNNEPCDPITGICSRCDAGWTGSRCQEACTDRTFGDGCRFLCSPCLHGNCHHVTGKCVCEPGFQGESCNNSCPALHFGLNCSSVCDCGAGVDCHSVTGVCSYSGRGAVLAGVLVPLLLLLLAVLCCCLCCGGGPADTKNRESSGDGSVYVRMKYHVYSVLANIGAALPCISDWSSGLPRVTVSHHDPESTFNHSFIEPPSSGWVTEGSSFDSDEEEGEALYCVPPREDIPAVAGGEFQEMSSKCNMFLDPSGFSCEDITSPFNIPRTSSIAKSKRPSVSFAEGTRFSPKERRGSAQDSAVLSRTKPKSPWGVLMLSSLQNSGGAPRGSEKDGSEGEGREEEVEVEVIEDQRHNCTAAEQEEERASAQVPACSGPATTSNTDTAASEAQPNKVTTVYVTVGKAGKPVTTTNSSSEGPVQAMLRRLGSLQRRQEQESNRTKPKKVDEITKPPRKKLGARARVWEHREPSAEEAVAYKPVRKKLCDAPGSSDGLQSESSTPARQPSFILKSVPEVSSADADSDLQVDGDQRVIQTESHYLTVGPAGDAARLPEVNVKDEPCYENIFIKHS
ncbi:scavenger receptor class F member 1 [Gouania willdenowi]|uniref:scavenger receptor class F member 1 n=1 Tax=Gouania willdenowi TaxID=441366 RepID=UPI00105629D5|nr:scavenger receptor class F member 1 [Gouania willdenowi]